MAALVNYRQTAILRYRKLQQLITTTEVFYRMMIRTMRLNHRQCDRNLINSFYIQVTGFKANTIEKETKFIAFKTMQD